MVLVSCAIASYNMAKTLPEAIRSALSQSFESFEVLVLDDGSTDETKRALRDFSKDSRVRVLSHSQRQGLTATRNRLLAEARGEFLSILDADDLWLPRKLESHLKAFKENPSAGMVWGRAIVLDVKTDAIEVIPSSLFAKSWDLTQDYQAVHSATTWRKSALLEVGKYDPEFTLVEDADMYLKVGDRYEQIYSPELVAIKRRDPGNEFRIAERDKERKALSQKLLKQAFYRRNQLIFPE